MNSPRAFKSFTLVFIQFLCLGLIVLTGPLLPASLILAAVQILGIALGTWAVLTMGLGNFNVTPDPVQSGRLVSGGPYRWIRHPMYLAVLVFALPLVLADVSILRTLLWITLFVDLLYKLNYEEGMLQTEIPGYPDYMRHTSRLVPGIY